MKAQSADNAAPLGKIQMPNHKAQVGLTHLARSLQFDSSADAKAAREDAALILAAAASAMVAEEVGVLEIVAWIQEFKKGS